MGSNTNNSASDSAEDSQPADTQTSVNQNLNKNPDNDFSSKNEFNKKNDEKQTSKDKNPTDQKVKNLKDYLAGLFQCALADYLEYTGRKLPPGAVIDFSKFAGDVANNPVIRSTFFGFDPKEAAIDESPSENTKSSPPVKPIDPAAMSEIYGLADRLISARSKSRPRPRSDDVSMGSSAVEQETELAESNNGTTNNRGNDNTKAQAVGVRAPARADVSDVEPVEPGSNSNFNLKREFPQRELFEQLFAATYREYGDDGVRLLRAKLLDDFASESTDSEWFEKQIDDIVSNIKRQSGMVNVRHYPNLPKDFKGGFQEVALQTSMLLSENANNPDFALALSCGPLAESVKELENGGLSAEKQVDLMVHAFAGDPVYKNGRVPPCNDGFRQFMARLVLLIRKDIKVKASPGQLETVINLATWYAQTDEKKCLAAGAGFSLESLDLFLNCDEQTQRVAHLLSRLTNNASGALADVLGFRGDEDKMESNPVQAMQLNALHALGTVAKVRSVDSAPWNANAVKVFEALGAKVDESKAGDMARAFIFMSNIPSSWRVLNPGLFGETLADNGRYAPRLRTAALALISAMVRARFNEPKDGDEIASALFNLGVDLNHYGNTRPKAADHVFLRSLANALGLWWALTKAETDEQALGAFNGGDCAVNLFGGLTETSFSELRRSKGDLIRRIGNAIQPYLSGQDGFRMQKSFRLMFDSDPVRVAFNREEIAKDVGRLIHEIEKLAGVIGSVTNEDALLQKLEADLVPVAADMLKQAFLKLPVGKDDKSAPEDKDATSALFQGWFSVAEKVVDLASRNNYDDFASGVEFVVRTKTQAVESGQNDKPGGKETAEATEQTFELIPRTLQGWGVGYDEVKITENDDGHLLSNTLSDRNLMAQVFGLAG